MATYKNIPILQNADTIAEIPAYTQSLAESLSEQQDFISLTVVSPFTGSIQLRKYGNMVHCLYEILRTSGSAIVTVATIPVGWRPTYDIQTFTVTNTGVRSEVRFSPTGVISEGRATSSATTAKPSAPVIWMAA